MSQVFENLRKFDGCNCRLNCRRASFNQDDRTFFKAWKPFNCEEEGKTLLSVILWDLGINICHIFKIGGPWNFLANWHQTWATLPKSQNFTMKGTMQLATASIYKVVVHCFKTLSPWDYPWLFGFLLYLWKVARIKVANSVALLVLHPFHFLTLLIFSLQESWVR